MYKIIRFYKDQDKTSRIIKKNLTLAEAQAHCKREDTHQIEDKITDWFDGYTEQ